MTLESNFIYTCMEMTECVCSSGGGVCVCVYIYANNTSTCPAFDFVAASGRSELSRQSKKERKQRTRRTLVQGTFVVWPSSVILDRPFR